MNIKLFSLCDRNSQSADSGKKAIYTCVKSFFPDCDGFYQFSSQKRMLLSIAQSLKAADIVVAAVQSSMYNATKRLLFSALDMDAIPNELVVSKLINMLNNGQIKQSTYENNISFPVGAEILPTDDFLNCGFVLSSGGQYIIYVPVDDPKAHEVVFGGLYDIFNTITSGVRGENDFSQRHKSIISRTAEKLVNQNVRVAVACHNCADIISDYTPNKYKQCFIFDERINSFNGEDPSNYIISIARQVRDNCNTQLGIAISKPVTDTDGRVFEYIAIADINGTNVIKIFAEQGDTEASLNEISVDELMIKLYEYNEFGVEEPQNNFNAKEQKQDKNLKESMGIGISVLALAASVAGFIVALLIK